MKSNDTHAWLGRFATIILLMTACGTAMAQVGNGGAQYSDLQSRSSLQLVPQFVAAAQSTLTAEAKLLDAFGKEGQREKLVAEASRLNSMTTRGDFELMIASRLAAGKLVSESITQKPAELSGAAKNLFAEGIVGLAASIKLYEELSVGLPEVKQALRNEGVKGGTALFIAKSLPQSIKEMKKLLAEAVVFARSNAIALPADLDTGTT